MSRQSVGNSRLLTRTSLISFSQLGPRTKHRMGALQGAVGSRNRQLHLGPRDFLQVGSKLAAKPPGKMKLPGRPRHPFFFPSGVSFPVQRDM